MNYDTVITALSADNWDLATSIFTLCIACYAVYTARRQLYVGRAETRSAQAHDIYQQYLAMCIKFPQFASGYATESKQDPKYDQYKWFVASLLFSFEQILEAKPKDQYWVLSITDQLKAHRPHLAKSRSVKNGQWHPSLQRILDRVIVEEV